MSARDDAVAAAAAEYGKEAGLNHMQRMVKAIAAYEATLSAAGWVVVPREPTREMQRAGEDEFWGPSAPSPMDIYRAMIGAALPAAPQEDRNDGR